MCSCGWPGRIRDSLSTLQLQDAINRQFVSGFLCSCTCSFRSPTLIHWSFGVILSWVPPSRKTFQIGTVACDFNTLNQKPLSAGLSGCDFLSWDGMPADINVSVHGFHAFYVSVHSAFQCILRFHAFYVSVHSAFQCSRLPSSGSVPGDLTFAKVLNPSRMGLYPVHLQRLPAIRAGN